MSPPQSAAQPSGQSGLPTLGRYEILCEIASGGMAKVYLGRVRGAGMFERLVAVKRCHPHLRKQPNFAAMFLDEARIAARIHHPNVVSTVDVQDVDDLYMVMEYVEGDRLEALTDAAANAGTYIPLKVLLRIALDVLAGLDAAHDLSDESGRRLNVVHRDVSPQNILVGVDGTTRITDFGIAKDVKRSAKATTGAPRGKLPYMSPEQVNSKPLTRASDLFSLGVVLWECLTNQRLFDGDVETVVMLKIAGGNYPAPSRVRADLPPVADRVVMRALAVRPEDRYRTAAEFADAIEQSGLEVANHRAVAACVNQLLARTIARRRELLNRLRTPGGQVDLDELESTVATPMPRGVARALASVAPGAASTGDDDDATDTDTDDRTVKTGPNFLAEIHSLLLPQPVEPPAKNPMYSASMPAPSYALPTSPSSPTVMLPSLRPPGLVDTAQPVVAPAPQPAAPGSHIARVLYAVSALLVITAVGLVIAAIHHRDVDAAAAAARVPVPVNAPVALPNALQPGSAPTPASAPTVPIQPVPPMLAPAPVVLVPSPPVNATPHVSTVRGNPPPSRPRPVVRRRPRNPEDVHPVVE